MAISREIRSIYVTGYAKAIGEVIDYLDSGSGSEPIAYSTTFYDRSTVTGVNEISKGGYFWGQSEGDQPGASAAANLDEDLTAGETTITTTNNVYFHANGGYGYILIEDEIIKYTGTSGDYDVTGCVRAQLDTADVQHDGTASTIPIYLFQRGVIQSIDYEPEDEVYAVRVALGALGGDPGEIVSYYIYRFEFSKHVVDLVSYIDTELTTSIFGDIPGYSQ